MMKQYKHSDHGANKSHISRRGTKLAEEMLPPPYMLQEYEYAAEGTVDRLLEMVEDERLHRNRWEQKYLQYHINSYRLGQVFGFIMVMVVAASSVFLGLQGHEETAWVLIVGFCSALIFSALVNRPIQKGRRSYQKTRAKKKTAPKKSPSTK